MSKKTVTFKESHQPISAVVRVDCHRKILSEYITGGNHRTTLRVVRVDTHRRIVSKTIHSDRTHIVPPVMWQHRRRYIHTRLGVLTNAHLYRWHDCGYIHCIRTHPPMICMYTWLYVCMYTYCMQLSQLAFQSVKVQCVCKLHYQYNLHHCIYMYMYTKTRGSIYCRKICEGYNLAIWGF